MPAAFVTLKTASAAGGDCRSATSAIRGFASGAKSATSIIPKLVEGFSLIQGGAGTFSEVLTLEFPKIAGIATKNWRCFFWFRQCCPNWASSLGSTIVSGIGGIVATLGGPLTIAIVAAIAGIIAIICNWDAVKRVFYRNTPRLVGEYCYSFL